MGPKQISIFDEGPSAPKATALTNRRLFSESALERELKRGREWRAAAAAAPGLRAAIRDAKDNGRTGMALDALGLRAARDAGGCIALAKEQGEPALLFLAADPLDTAARCRLMLQMNKEKIDWGVVSDGSRWRLLRRGIAGAPDRWFEADGGALADADDDALTTFTLLFGAARFSEKESFADAGFRLTRVRADSFVGRLRAGAREAATAISRGFIFAEQEATGAVPADDALGMIYKHALVIVQRIVYLFYAEAAGLFPANDPRYEADMGLGRLATAAKTAAKSKKTAAQHKFTLWDSLGRLFGAAFRGDAELKVPCQGGALFDPDLHPFLDRNSAPDSLMAAALAALALDGGYAELDAADIVEALAPLAELSPRLAAEQLVLVSEDGAPVLLPKKQAKWKKTLAAYEKGDFYLEERVPETPKQPREVLAEYAARAFGGGYRGGHVLITDAGAGLSTVYAVDAAACALAVSNGKYGAYCDALRAAADRVFALDPNPLNVELTRLGVWLLTINPSPPVYSEYNIRAGSALCGAGPEDIAMLPAGAKLNAMELSGWARELVEARGRKRGGLAGVRSRDAGFAKVERKLESALRNPEVRTALGEPDPAAAAGLPPTVHPPVFFSEVFYGEGAAGFEIILSAPEPKRLLTSAERIYLRRRIGLRGVMSGPDAAGRRYMEFLAAGGTLSLLAPARFLKTDRARSLLASDRMLPGIADDTARSENLPAGFAMVFLKKR